MENASAAMRGVGEIGAIRLLGAEEVGAVSRRCGEGFRVSGGRGWRDGWGGFVGGVGGGSRCWEIRIGGGAGRGWSRLRVGDQCSYVLRICRGICCG